MTQHGDLITGEITGLSSSGQGVLRHEGLVVFIPYSAPGDQLTCRIMHRKRTFATAEIVEIHKESTQRTVPPCPYYGLCGGCQLQHVDYHSQLEHKRQCVEEAFRRIGHLKDVVVPPIVPAQQQWGYRRHISLTLRPQGNSGFVLGYIANDNRSLIPVEHCLIFVDDTNKIIQEVGAAVAQLHVMPDNQGKATILKQEEGQYLICLNLSHLPNNCPEIFESCLQKHRHWAGIIVSAPGKTLTFGTPTAKLHLDGLHFSFSPQAFIQNNPEQSLNIYRAICQLAKKSKIKDVLDLYCGIGISSLLLAKQGCTVLGVESNLTAVRLAKANASSNRLPHARFVQGDVQEVLTGILRQQMADLILVNPPRTGLTPEIIATLLKQSPAELIYISCMPATLARDLSLLCACYRIDSCQVFDMFPRTAHVETLVHLKK